MSNKYKSIKSTLKSCQYNLEIIEGTKELEIDLRDSITINAISDNNVKLSIKRYMTLGKESSVFMSTVFDIILDTNSIVTKEEFIEDIKKGISILSSAFSRISLLISQITFMSPVGAIITPPSYDINHLDIS